MLANVLVIAASVTHLDVGFFRTSVRVLFTFFIKLKPYFYFAISASSLFDFLLTFENLSLTGSLM